MSQSPKRLSLIILIVIASLIVDLPRDLPINQKFFNKQLTFNFHRPGLNLKLGQFQFSRDLEAKLGLDLAGGTRVTLEANMSEIPSQDREDALSSTKEVISRRVDLFGVSEPNIFSQQTGDTNQIVVELPGLDDPEKALELIGTTAQLEFLTPVYAEATDSSQPQLIDFSPSNLTGADLKKTSVTFDSQTSEPVVSLQFSPEGAKKFADLTKRYLNKPIGIALDRQLITYPTVQSEITTGEAIISGKFTIDSAKA